jgi:GAF domain-containing protein
VTEGENGRGQPSGSFTGAATGWNELAETLGSLSRSLQSEGDLPSTLRAIVAAAVDTVPGVDHASISAVRRRREVETLACTDDLALAVDQAQYQTGEGPCLSSLYEKQTVRLNDMAAETRWPAFATRAHELGMGSMLAIQLYVAGEDLGALNLHSARADAFTDESEHVGLLFAAHAAVAMVGAQQQAQLQTALDSRDVIGQAKGILMERFKVGAQDAFRMLVLASQTTNIKLTDVADYLTRTGLLASRTP